MQKIAQFKVDENTTILVETSEDVTTHTNQGMGHAGIIDDLKAYVIGEAKEKFTDVISIISYSANTMLKEIEKIKEKPSQTQVEFGVKFTGEGKAMLASGGVEANYKITLSWNNSK